MLLMSDYARNDSDIWCCKECYWYLVLQDMLLMADDEKLYLIPKRMLLLSKGTGMRHAEDIVCWMMGSAAIHTMQ
jgi:hypothetical protein